MGNRQDEKLMFGNQRKSIAIAVTSFLTVGFIFAGLGAVIALRTAIALHNAPVPQGILMLGGNTDREAFTARFAQQHETLDIWVSSGLPRPKAMQIFRAKGIGSDRLHLDYRAVDTVTNFSTLVEDLQDRNIQHVYLITSDFHMPRAAAIAHIILGSQGIAFTPVAVPTLDPPESWTRIARDAGRSVLWALTGHTGATLNPHYPRLREIADRDARSRSET